MINKSSELKDVIDRFRRNFREGKPTYGAYFVPSDKIPLGSVYISKIAALKVRPHDLPSSARPDHDYAITIHPLYLEQLRAEFRRLVPGVPLNDREMASIVVGGSI